MTGAIVAVVIVVVIVLLLIALSVRVAREYERGVVFRLGRLLTPPKGPGLFFLIPIIDKMVRVDLRTVTLNVPPQEVITKDNVPVRVNAVAYFRIIEPSAAIVQVENFMVATSQIAQTTLRNVLGQHMLDELLSERDKINTILQQIIDEATSPWGVKVSIVEVKDVEIPTGMQRAMARQAEAERERRGKVIAAEGEFQASQRLKDAADVISQQPDRPPASLPPDDARDELGAEHDADRAVSDRPPSAVPREAAADSGRPHRPTVLTLPDPELRVDPLSGSYVVVAPGRGFRPGVAAAAADDAGDEAACPFCEGHESETPPETLALAEHEREPDTPGWQVRVVPNLYPLFVERQATARTTPPFETGPAYGRHEVVVHTPRHVLSIADLTEAELEAVATAWRLRAESARRCRFRSHARIRQRGPRRRRQPAAHPLAARRVRAATAGSRGRSRGPELSAVRAPGPRAGRRRAEWCSSATA